VKLLIFHEDASAEVEEAVAWYEERREGLGSEFRQELEALLGRIQQNPQAFLQYNDQGVRRGLLRRFPYTVFFREYEDRIWIAAVVHQKRKPGYWSARDPE
jgi:plasmid stabilization system protein ParE